MVGRRLFAWAAAPPLICCLFLVPAAGAASPPPLKANAPQALPAGKDARLGHLLARHKGKAVVLNFWATWCEPCREEMPSLARLDARWQAKGLTVLTVAVADSEKRVEEFLWETLPGKQTLPVLHDREQTISRAWGARMLPTTVVLDRKHRIVARGRGAIDWDAPAIDKQLQSLLN